MTEILAFIGFLSFLATTIIVIYGWYNWRTHWEQKYDNFEKNIMDSMECRCKEFHDRLQQIEHRDLIS